MSTRPELPAIRVNQVALERRGGNKAVLVCSRDDSLDRIRLLDEGGASAGLVSAEEIPGFTEWGEGLRHYRVTFSDIGLPGACRLEARLESGVSIVSPVFRIADGALLQSTFPSVVGYLHASRNTDERDRSLTVIDSDRVVDAWGGWDDAGGDSGKYLSHLGYSNFLVPQQAPLVAWSLMASFENARAAIEDMGLAGAVVQEGFWGADFLCRMLSEEGYFYTNVFDRWGRDDERRITAYVGLEGEYGTNYQAAFRKGGGVAIAALARAFRLARDTGSSGDFSASRYLEDAVRAFDHLVEFNARYCEDGEENLVDDYTALLAAVELFRSTDGAVYLEHARARARALSNRRSRAGYLFADGGKRPFYHAAEAGFPVVSLLHYLDVESDPMLRAATRKLLAVLWRFQFDLDREAPNPFDYPRQPFRTYEFEEGALSGLPTSGFFMPQANETGYWWQGENARLVSLAAAARLSVTVFGESEEPSPGALADALESFARDQLDWILGKNPYGICMLYGHGERNPQFSESGGAMVVGGISNGITGRMGSAEGRGIDFAAGDKDSNWRWVEQWTPHAAWYLYAVSLG